MKVTDSSRTNVAFKSFYMVKGSNDALDEICWFLRKKLAKPESSGMDFLDIRLNAEPKSPIQRLMAPSNEAVKRYDDSLTTYIETPAGRLKRHTQTVLDTDVSQFDLSYKLLKRHEWVNKDRIKPIEDVEGSDLIITDADKPPVERAIANIAEESAQTKFSGRTMTESARILGDNMNEVQEKLYRGLPIVNLRQNIVRQFLPLQFLEVPIRKAQEVLEQIQRNNFDPHTVLNLQG